MFRQGWRNGSGLVGASQPRGSGRCRSKRPGEVAQQVRLRAGGSEGEADAGSALADAGCELQEPQPDRGELGPGQAVRLRDGVPHGEHQPVGGGVQNQPHLVGSGVPAGGAVGGELALVQLDQVHGLSAGAVQLGVEPCGRAGRDVGDPVANVEAEPGRLDAGGDAALLPPGLGRMRGLGKAAHRIHVVDGPHHPDVIGRPLDLGRQRLGAGQSEDVSYAVVLATLP